MNHSQSHLAHTSHCNRRQWRERLAALIHAIRLGLLIRRERRSLAALCDWQLRDVGLSREQARAEARRGVLDLPAGRTIH